MPDRQTTNGHFLLVEMGPDTQRSGADRRELRTAWSLRLRSFVGALRGRDARVPIAVKRGPAEPPPR